MSFQSFDDLNRRIVACDRCPRLRAWCQDVAVKKRRAFQGDEYWGRPVPNFGDRGAKGLIVGLAPAAHGANRTGRMFTGDRSGDWLYAAMHRVGLANQPLSDSAQDGLVLTGVAITAVCHCAPPDNKPTPDEVANCAPFLSEALANPSLAAILCLGSLAWAATHRHLGVKPLPAFGHGVRTVLRTGPTVLGSYHPSQQNTFTGRLTMDMLVAVLDEFAALVNSS